MKLKIIATTSITAALCTTLAFAGTPEQNMPITHGFYIGAEGGYGTASTLDPLFSKIDKDSGFDYQIDAGYQVNRHFAVETGFHHAPDIMYTSTIDNTTKGGFVNNYSAYLAAVGILPFTNRFNLYGKFGLSAAHTKLQNLEYQDANGAIIKGNDTAIALYLATGLGYKVTNHIQINAEINSTIPNDFGVNNFKNIVPITFGADLGASYIF